ncbi:MAG: C2 family cysteine protease [Gemmataceae bacterium]
MFRPFALGAALILLGAASRADDTKTPPFKSIVEDNFAKWDKNHDGKLSALEIDLVIKDHNVTDAPAAAVAAIHLFFRKNATQATITKADLLKDFKGGDDGRRDQNGGANNIPKTYRMFHTHLSHVPREIFAKPEAPRVPGMTQGYIGDCFLVASIGAAVHRNPEHVRKLITVHKDGSCEVTFPGVKTVKVPKLTDAEICLGSSARDQGLWLNVFEKALGELTYQTKGSKNPKDIDIDTISRGGSTADVLKLLTAHQIVTVSLKPDKPHTKAELAALQGQLHKLMQTATLERHLMCCATSGGTLPHGIVSHHAYAIVGYDAASQTVHIWNPWGGNYDVTLKPGLKPGLENGYEISKGMFAIPLNDFVHVFSSFLYETPAVAPKGK